MFTSLRVDSDFVLATCFRWSHVNLATFTEAADDSTGCQRSHSTLISPPKLREDFMLWHGLVHAFVFECSL